MANRRKVILALFATIATLSFPRPAPAAQMIGYWAAYAKMPLSQTSPNYDVIELAFATPNTDGATITFVHNVGTESDAQLTADVANMHAAGKKVLLSIGGATATNLNLATAANITSFETSVESIIDKFGLDGIDLDLENGAMNLNAGDNDIFNPTTPKCVNLITACHDLRNHYGPAFMLTMPPQTADIDAYGQYGTVSTIGWGDFLPLIYGTRDMLSFVATQDYNSGTMYGPDGAIYTCGTQDFDVAVTELLLAGYHVANGQNFPALQPGQVAFGVPATSGSAHKGYLAPTSVLAVAKYIGSGTSFGGAYVLRNPAGYPGYAGVMDWDINDDQGASYAMANTLAPYLHSIAGGNTVPSVPTGLSATAGNTQVTLTWNPTSGATSYNVFRSTSPGAEGTVAYSSPAGNSYTDTGVTNGTTYYYKVSAANANGQSAQSSEVSAKPNIPPAAPSGLTAAAASGTVVNLAWTNNATGATGNEIWRSTNNANFTKIVTTAATATTYSDTTAVKSTTYYYKVDATNGVASPFSNTATVTTPRH